MYLASGEVSVYGCSSWMYESATLMRASSTPSLSIRSRWATVAPNICWYHPTAAPAPAAVAASPVADLTSLQALAGNRTVCRVVQPKLAVGRADDPLEQEADEVAREVVRSILRRNRSDPADPADPDELARSPIA